MRNLRGPWELQQRTSLSTKNNKTENEKPTTCRAKSKTEHLDKPLACKCCPVLGKLLKGGGQGNLEHAVQQVVAGS